MKEGAKMTQNKKVIRYDCLNPGANAEALLSIIGDTNSKKIILFATPFKAGEPNAPLVAAFVEYEIPKVIGFQIVFDGELLTANRPQRYWEVKEVLDYAVESGKVAFGIKAIQLTESLAPEVAANIMTGTPVEALTSMSRPEFFSLLSNLPEDKCR